MMSLQRLLFLSVCFFLRIFFVAAGTSPVSPPALPLAVKSPYLNVWLLGRRDLPGTNPTFWNGAQKGWTGLIRVDGKTYTWMGQAPAGSTLATQTSATYTSTRTIFQLDVGSSVSMTVTFLSPIAPEDLKRQSLAFSYLDVQVTSKDGTGHQVQIHADITGQWASGDANSVIQWEQNTTSSGVTFHKISRQTQQIFTEFNEQAEYGSWYWATKSDKDVTFQSGDIDTVRGQFGSNGTLLNAEDTDFRPINQRMPTFGLAKDFGTINPGNSVEALFVIGLAQHDAVQFVGTGGEESVPSLWTSYFETGEEALDFFYNDYHTTASKAADTFDDRVTKDSIAAGGQDYLTITSLAARQSFGATQLAGTSDKPYLFLKEISSSGNIQTVDVIFPFHPILLYSNPLLLKYSLDPLFENQESGHYPHNYSMHDLGARYPNATGHPDGNDEQMPLEECGNMLIMTYSYATRSGDVGYLKTHYDILKKWTGYLVEDALLPANQISTDDFAGPLANQTNLALKGIIGIGAMREIAKSVGNEDDTEYYGKLADEYIAKWQTYAIAERSDRGLAPHTTLSYGVNDTSGLLYNLYCDNELELNLVPKKVYDIQSAFYPTLKTKGTYGVPLDTRHSYTKGDWEMFVAAVSSQSTRDMFVGDLAKWIGDTQTNVPFTDLYEVGNGDFGGGIRFMARPVMGGAFALLALKG